jgi:hypothetical protein
MVVRVESGEQAGVVFVAGGESVESLAAKSATLGPSAPYSAFLKRRWKKKGCYHVANKLSRDRFNFPPSITCLRLDASVASAN